MSALKLKLPVKSILTIYYNDPYSHNLSCIKDPKPEAINPETPNQGANARLDSIAALAGVDACCFHYTAGLPRFFQTPLNYIGLRAPAGDASGFYNGLGMFRV